MKLPEHSKNLNIASEIKSLGQQLGHGHFSRVYTVKYAGMTCAAKEIHPFQSVKPEEKQKFRQTIEACCYSGRLSHPNIVQFLGLYYSSQHSVPVMIMELMDMNLTTYLERYNINFSKKVSILQDTVMGLNFLHGRSPPVVHRDLSSDNILLKYTKDEMLPIAKIKLSVAKVVGACVLITEYPVTAFTPPEILIDPKKHSTFSDMFSFGCVTLHIFSQGPIPMTATERKGTHWKRLTEIDRRKRYFDMITEEAATLKPLIEACLNEVPECRPSASVLLRNIKQLIVCMRIMNLNKE